VEPTGKLPIKYRHPMLPISSVHVLKERNIILDIGGFHEHPDSIARYDKLTGEQLGRSPSMRSLPDIKTANSMMKSWLEGAQLAIKPPVQMPDDGALVPAQLIPGGKNFYRADSKDRIEPIYTGADPRIGNEVIELLHRRIEQNFDLDKLHMVENDRMTATEVMQRRDENMRVLNSPTHRLNYELFAPQITRTFNECLRRGVLPQMPEGLRKEKVELRFVSQLVKAQDSIEIEAYMRGIQIATSMAQINPEVVDAIDFDAGTRFVFKALGAPVELLKKQSDVDAIRQQRQAAQQAAQQAETNKMNASAYKDMAETPDEEQGAMPV
jgi:hypothetical protein